jgi:hypothetical protein
MTGGFNEHQQYDADFVIFMVGQKFYIRVLLDRRPYSDVGPFDSYTECSAALADLYRILDPDIEGNTLQ